MDDKLKVDDRARLPMPRGLRDRLKILAAKARVTMVDLISAWVQVAEARQRQTDDEMTHHPGWSAKPKESERNDTDR